MSLLAHETSASQNLRQLSRRHSRHSAAPAGPFTACRTTPYPQLCSHILHSLSAPPAAPLSRQIATVSSFALSLTSSSYRLARHLASIPQARSAPRSYKGALQDCIDLMSNTMDQLQLSISRLSDLNSAHSSPYVLRSRIMDAQVSLSASFTYQDTCSDELHQRNVPPAAAQLLKQVGDTSRAVTVALAMADTLHHRISP
ncbi:hypothetical protein L7F22_024569 [Adiantum nelumboides]|nr:hypothetical protein [Adiantum nelumboides]